MYQADSLTVTTSKAKYDQCRNKTFSAVNKVLYFAWGWFTITAVTLLALFLDLAFRHDQNPPLIQLGVAITQNHFDINAGLRVLMMIMTGLYMVLTTTIFIEAQCFKKATSVNSAKRFARVFFYQEIAIAVTLLMSFIFIISATSKNAGALVLCMVLHSAWDVMNGFMLVFTSRAIVDCSQ